MSATDSSSFSTAAVTTKLGTIDTVNYDNKTGVITFNGQKLDLTGIGDAKTDTLTFQKDGMFINVYKGSESYRLNYSDGKQVKQADGVTLETATKALDNTKSALYINGSGGAGSDVIINTKAGTVAGGGGKDKIFNFAEGATIQSGNGDTFIYSVGLGSGGSITTGAGDNNIKITSAMSGGNITTGAGDNNITLVGNMTGGTVKFGAGKNQLDATGYALSGVTIEDVASTKLSSVTAKSLATSTVKLLGEETSVKATTVDTGNNITFGDGENSLVATTVKAGTTMKGAGSYQIATMDGATIDATGSTNDVEIKITGSAKGATFKFGGGSNLLYAAGRTLDSVTITDETDANTTIVAGNLLGASSIVLKGGAGGNTVDISGAIKGAAADSRMNIDTGKGEGFVRAGSIANADVKMDAGGTDDTNVQTFVVKGNVASTNLTTGKADDVVSIGGTVTGDSTFTLAEGDDAVSIGGAVNGATFKLGDGENTFTAQNSKGVGQTLTNVSISSTGTADTDSTTITAGAYKVTDAAKGKIDLQGKGSNDIILNSIAGTTAAKATVTIGAADSDKAQSLTVKGAVSNAGVTTGKGDDTILINGGVANSDFDLSDGTNTFTAVATVKGKQVYQTLSNVNFSSSGSAATDKTSITAGAYKTGSLGNVFDLLGDGANEVTLNSITGAKAANNLDIFLGSGTSTAAQALTVNGNVNNTDVVAAGTGNDVINIKGAITGATTIDMADGDNELTVGKSANGLTYVGTDADGKDDVTIGGGVSNSIFNLGEGANSFTAVATVKGKQVYQTLSNVDITASGATATDATTILAGAFKNGKTTSNKIELGYGNNDVTLNSISGYNSKGVRHDAQIILGSDTQDFAQKLKVTGSVNGMDYIGKSKGADTIEILGALANASFEVGAGDNSLTVGKSVKGISYIGTDGKDDISVGLGGAANSAFDLGAGANSLTAVATVKGNAVYQTLADVNIDASGTAATDITTIKAGAFKNGASAANHVKLGGGANDVTFTSIGGYKSKTVQHNVEMTFGAGADKITVNGAITNAIFDLGAGNNVLSATKEDKAGNIRGQALTDVTIKGGAGDDTITYGSFKATKLSDDPATPSAFVDLGTGADKINIFA